LCLSVCSVLFPFLVVSASAVDCLERLIFEMTYYVSSGTLNHTHCLTQYWLSGREILNG